MHKITSRHSAIQDKDFLFNLVADIDAYHLFLPTCTKSKVLEKNGENLVAALTLGYGPLNETIICDVVLNKAQGMIEAHLKEGRIKKLYCRWDFSSKEQGTDITCAIDLEFQNGLTKIIASPLIGRATERILDAFIERANHLEQV